MAYQEEGQLTLAEGFLARAEGGNRQLKRIAELLDFRPLERMVKQLHRSELGRPAFRALVMLKALLLQQWYSLSDPALEEALADRLSFRKFVGLRAHEPVPDYSTISRFRSALSAGGLEQKILAEVNRQLEAQRLMVKRGTLVDATLVEAAVAKPGMGDGAGARSPLDPDADWTRRGAHSHFGYKAHVAVDEASGLIRKAMLTDAKVAEVEVAEQLLCGDERTVYADKAYDSERLRGLLARCGIGDGIMRRAWWGQAHHPDPQLVARNRRLSKTRSAVERIFGLMKRSYGYRRVRYRGLARNALQLALLCVAINLRRALVLSG